MAVALAQAHGSEQTGRQPEQHRKRHGPGQQSLFPPNSVAPPPGLRLAGEPFTHAHDSRQGITHLRDLLGRQRDGPGIEPSGRVGEGPAQTGAGYHAWFDPGSSVDEVAEEGDQGRHHDCPAQDRGEPDFSNARHEARPGARPGARRDGDQRGRDLRRVTPCRKGMCALLHSHDPLPQRVLHHLDAGKSGHEGDLRQSS